eukprot:6508120-Alexandrium_andersonii.AAC.1
MELLSAQQVERNQPQRTRHPLPDTTEHNSKRGTLRLHLVFMGMLCVSGQVEVALGVHGHAVCVSGR